MGSPREIREMPEVSVVIPTHNRPQLLERALRSVLNQTYGGAMEVIVVDVGLKQRSDKVVEAINDPRVIYIQSPEEKNGSEARNIGIKKARGGYIAFLDDDDEWLPEKLKIQMDKFENTPPDVGFSFTAVINVLDGNEEMTHIPDGIDDYLDLALEYSSAFLTVTLMIKKDIFDVVGMFDEQFPSNQEADLIIRITKQYRGLGINRSLTRVNMQSEYRRVGSDLNRRIRGREMLLEKHRDDFNKRPFALGPFLFLLGILYRNNKQYRKARKAFVSAYKVKHRLRYLMHYFTLMLFGLPYRILRKLK